MSTSCKWEVDVLLKSLFSYKAYVFAEGLVSLTLMTVVIGGYLSVNSLLFSKSEEQMKQLLMGRILYEEVRGFVRWGGQSSKSITRDGVSYAVVITISEGYVTKARINQGEDSFSIEVEE